MERTNMPDGGYEEEIKAEGWEDTLARAMCFALLRAHGYEILSD